MVSGPAIHAVKLKREVNYYISCNSSIELWELQQLKINGYLGVALYDRRSDGSNKCLSARLINSAQIGMRRSIGIERTADGSISLMNGGGSRLYFVKWLHSVMNARKGGGYGDGYQQRDVVTGLMNFKDVILESCVKIEMT